MDLSVPPKSPNSVPICVLPGGQPPLREVHLRVVGEQVEDAAARRRDAAVVERLQVLERDRLALLVGHRPLRHSPSRTPFADGEHHAPEAAIVRGDDHGVKTCAPRRWQRRPRRRVRTTGSDVVRCAAMPLFDRVNATAALIRTFVTPFERLDRLPKALAVMAPLGAVDRRARSGGRRPLPHPHRDHRRDRRSHVRRVVAAVARHRGSTRGPGHRPGHSGRSAGPQPRRLRRMARRRRRPPAPTSSSSTPGSPRRSSRTWSRRRASR